MNKDNLNDILKNFEKHINKTIYSYLLILMKYIFLGKENFHKKKKKEKIMAKLREFTKNINQKIINKEEDFIQIEPLEEIYTFKNLMNIINFVKNQNLMFAGDIIEGILIIIFSYGIKTSTEDDFGKYIFMGLAKFKDLAKSDLPKWFENGQKIFQPKEIKNIALLLSKDFIFKKTILSRNRKPVLLEILIELTKNKLNFLKSNTKNTECTRYIFNGVLNILKTELKLFNSIKNYNSITGVENDLVINSIAPLYYYIMDKKETPIRLISSLLISVYIYNQNRISPFINPLDLQKEIPDKEKDLYNAKDPDIVDVPFCYDLRFACLEGANSNIIISPISIEPRISKIDFLQNNIREIGLFELGKMLSFNKKIKSLNLRKSLIRGYYLDYFTSGFGIFDNYNLKYLNLSFSYLNCNSEETLPKLFKHFKGVKTLNLTGNEIKGGAKGLFILLKKLYRTGKIELENLYLNNCSLSDSSFYELGELLKSQFCGLKFLSIGGNRKSQIINFLKKIKLNKSLEELILYKSGLNDDDFYDICKIISNTNIHSLNLFKNDFHNFELIAKIIFRTRIIKRKNQNIDKSLIELNKSFMNLDLSYNIFNSESFSNNNACRRMDYGYINLINELIQDNCTLSCLDISHIYYRTFSEKYKRNMYKLSSDYKTAVENAEAIIKNRKEYYDNIFIKRQVNLINIERYEKKNDEEKLKNLSQEIINYIKDEILVNELSFFPGYLMEECKYILNEIIFKNEERHKNLIKEENLINSEKFEENELFIRKLMDYIKYERAKEENVKINREIEFRNLIII